jgi:DNA polymerase III epsilon subunit-like protein
MTQDTELLAQQLEQHPDYRVLRRLVPGRVFNTPAPGQKLSKGVVLDTETTGFDVTTDRVIELGMLAFEFDPLTGVIYRVVDVLDELEDPGFPIPPATTAVHHITDDMVKGQLWESAATVADAVVEGLIANPPSEPVVVNVNVPNLPISEIKKWRRTVVGSDPPRAMATATMEQKEGHNDSYYVRMAWGDELTLPIHTDGGAVGAGEVSITYISRLEGYDIPADSGPERAIAALLGL